MFNSLVYIYIYNLYMCNIVLVGSFAGEELWGREQTGAGEENPAGQEAGAAA